MYGVAADIGFAVALNRRSTSTEHTQRKLTRRNPSCLERKEHLVAVTAPTAMCHLPKGDQ